MADNTGAEEAGGPAKGQEPAGFREAEKLLHLRFEIFALANELAWPQSRHIVHVGGRLRRASSQVEDAVLRRWAVAEVARLLRRALSGLTWRERLVLALRYGDAKLTWREIDRLRIPGFSGSSARRARDRLVRRVATAIASCPPKAMKLFWRAWA